MKMEYNKIKKDPNYQLEKVYIDLFKNDNTLNQKRNITCKVKFQLIEDSLC